MTTEEELSAHKASRIAYASEFPFNSEGQPDVGSIHENIRKMKARLKIAEDLLATQPFVADLYRKECENRGIV